MADMTGLDIEKDTKTLTIEFSFNVEYNLSAAYWLQNELSMAGD
jgi:hypothetical protein